MKNKQLWIYLVILSLGLCSILTGCYSGKSSAVVSQVAAEGMIEQAKAETAADEGELSVSSSISQVLPSSRKLIRNVDMNVESTEFEKLVSQITSKVTELGGYIESSSISGLSASSYQSGDRRYANITARVPQDQLDQLIQDVESAGNVTNKSEQVTDVTLQYTDIESHKKSLAVEQERLWALLEKADTLEAVIALEERLSEIRYQLESYESQLRLYDNQISYSTVTMFVSEVRHFTPTAPDTVSQRIKKGFSKSLTQLSDTGIDFFVWLLSNSPILVILALILISFILILKKIAKKRRSSLYQHFGFHKEGKEKQKGPEESSKEQET